MFFLLLTAFGLSWGAALFGALLLLLDNGLLVQTRIITMDALLLLALISAIYAALKAVTSQKRPQWAWASIAGTAAALAVGSKFTGLTAPALVFFIFLAHTLKRRADWKTLRGMWLSGVLSFFFIYIGGWWVHFRGLTETGYADQFYKLQGNFWLDLVNLHQAMLQANAGLSAGHSDGSPWWHWLIMEKPVYYWVEGAKRIYFVGNPAVWWGTTLGLVAAFITFTIWAIQKKRMGGNYLWILPLGYLIAFLPYVGVSRVLFLYHYLPPLFFASAIVSLWLDQLGLFSKVHWLRSLILTGIILSVVLFGFLLMAPFTYGLEPLGWQRDLWPYISTIWKSG